MPSASISPKQNGSLTGIIRSITQKLTENVHKLFPPRDEFFCNARGHSKTAYN